MAQTQTASSKAETYRWGCEIECFLPDQAINELRISIGSYHHGHPLPAPFPQGWTAERDGSLHTERRGYVAIEIVSPVLRGRAGIEQVKQVAQTLKELGAAVNTSAGLPVHIGVQSVAGDRFSEVAEWVAKLLYHVAMHETALYASTGTHRRENGGYARSIKAQKNAADRVRRAPNARKPDALEDAVYGLARYHTLNLTNLFTRKATVEFRHGAGTVEWTKMVAHIQMALALCERATETAKMDWGAVASERTYHVRGKGLRELNRFFYLAGWTLGRRDVGKSEVAMARWIADLADLKPVKRELKRLARKYDRAAGLLKLDRVGVIRRAVGGEPFPKRPQRLLAGEAFAP
jgi:hypothetical protein